MTLTYSPYARIAGFEVEEQVKGGVEGAQAISNAVLAVFFAALFLQLIRWLLIRREFSKVALKATRDMKLAHFNVLVALAENVPQAVLSALFAGLVGWSSWNALKTLKETRNAAANASAGTRRFPIVAARSVERSAGD